MNQLKPRRQQHRFVMGKFIKRHKDQTRESPFKYFDSF
jgi:hypothetical protein